MHEGSGQHLLVPPPRLDVTREAAAARQSEKRRATRE